MRLIFGILVLVLSSATTFSVQAEENTIYGWGKLKFGMSKEEVKRADESLEFYSYDDPILGADNNLYGTAVVNGLFFKVSAFFNSTQEELSRIQLRSETKNTTKKKCAAQFEDFLLLLEKKYGRFYPGRGDPDRGISAVLGKRVELPGGKSIYINSNDVQRTAWLERKTGMGGPVELNSFWSVERGTCTTSITYTPEEKSLDKPDENIEDTHGL